MSAASEAVSRSADSELAARVETLPDVVAANATARPDAVAVLYKRYGIWQRLSWRELRERVERASHALAAVGLRRGEPVALISDPRPGWLVADLAVQAAGGVSVAVHPTQSEADLRGIFAASPIRFAFVGDDEQLELADAALDGLERRVILDPSFVRRSHEEGSEPLLEFSGAGRRTDRRHSRIRIPTSSRLASSAPAFGLLAQIRHRRARCASPTARRWSPREAPRSGSV